MKEYRKNIRVDLKNEYKGKTSDGVEFAGMLDDISIAGIGLWCNSKIHLGSEVDITFKIDDEIVTIKGAILYKYKKNDEFRYGVKFLDLESKYVYLINRYIRREILIYLSETEK